MDIVLCDTCEGTGKVDQWVGNEREPREGVCPKCFGHRVVYRRQFVLETSLGRRDEMIDKERRILNIIRE